MNGFMLWWLFFGAATFLIIKRLRLPKEKAVLDLLARCLIGGPLSLLFLLIYLKGKYK